MFILAFDPGSRFSGYAHVWCDGARVRYQSAGQIEAEYGALARVLYATSAVPGAARTLVAVERPTGFVHDPVRGAHLMATSNVAGGTAWASRALGFEVIEVAPATVRKAVLGKRAGGRHEKGEVDRLIKEALPGLVLGLPKRTNEHVRDALALAVAANWMLLSKRRSA